MLGHNRDIITAAYYGSLIRKQSSNEQARFRTVIAAGVHSLQEQGANEQPPQECRVDVLVLADLLATEDNVEISLAKVYQLWKVHSARFGLDWAPLETGIRQALEAAAIHVTRRVQALPASH